MHDLKIIRHIGLAGAKGEALVYMLIMRPQLWGARGGRGGGVRVLLFLILVTLGADIPYPKSSKNVRPKSKRACRGRCLGGGT